MLPRVGVAKRSWAFYEKNGVGVSGLTVTCDYHDEAANWVTGQSASAGGRAGWYYYDITPDAQGTWGGTFVTAGDVDQKEIGFDFFVGAASATPDGIAAAVWAIATSTLTGLGTIGKWIVDYLNASVAAITPGLVQRSEPDNASIGTMSSTIATNLDAKVSTRSSHSAADVWAVATRTLTGYGTLVADVATAVWAAATRTLTSVGSLGTSLAAAVWDRLIASPATAGSILDQLITKLALITSGSVHVVAGPVSGFNLTLYQGTDYELTDPQPLTWTTTISLLGATIRVIIYGALVDGSDASFTGSVVSQYVAGLALTAAQTSTLQVGESGSASYTYRVIRTLAGKSKVVGAGECKVKRAL